MRKSNVVILFIIVAIVFGIIGLLIGMNINSSTKEKSMVGTYKTSTWNGKDAVLVLNSDGTMIYPTGARGTWTYEDGKLYVEFETSYSYADGEIHTEKKNTKTEITIVSGGLMINTHFFEKVK